MQTFRAVVTSEGHPNVDAPAGIIRDVVLIAEGEIKWDRGFADHRTLETVMACAQSFGADGLPIMFNPLAFDHGPASMAGSARDFRIDGTKLVADLHLLQFYREKDYLLEMASRQPNTFGLSIECYANNKEIGGKEFMRCEEIMCATVVVTPAATRGLFKASEKKPLDAKNVKLQGPAAGSLFAFGRPKKQLFLKPR